MQIQTRRVLAPQKIGNVEVEADGYVWVNGVSTAEDMRAAAATLIAMADTLEGTEAHQEPCDLEERLRRALAGVQ